jgi:hypothetical protein
MRGRIPRSGTTLSAIALAGVLAATSACRTGAPMGNGAPRRSTATVEVQNNDINDRVIYAVRDGMRQRLGIANAAATSYFTIPAAFVLGSPQLRFSAEVLGGTRPAVTERTQVAPGDTVEMVIMGS